MCLDFKTGEIKWRQEGFGRGLLLAADHKLIIVSDTCELAIAEASPEDFKQIASAQLIGGNCLTVPTLWENKLYLRNKQGEMICIDLSKPK